MSSERAPPPGLGAESAPPMLPSEPVGQGAVRGTQADTLAEGDLPTKGVPANRAVKESVVAVKDAAPPGRIGRYVILRQLGAGGMGVVYSAYDSDLDRKVAVKVVRANVQRGSVGRARVLQEAQALARLAHPNIVHVYEVGQDPESGEVFIAMEFVAGDSLSTWQQRHPVRNTQSFDACLRLYLQAATGLAAAHQAGLVHRDFKPDNVLIGEDGRVRVLDFGVARAVDRLVPAPAPAPTPAVVAISARPPAGAPSPELGTGTGERLTQVGSILGTPGYMAPEQVRGEEADSRSDQFSFCAALYEALYGQLPFSGESFVEYAENLLAGRRQSLPRSKAALPEVPMVVEKALQRGLSLAPSARFTTMHELIAQLSQGLQADAESERAQHVRRRALFGLAGGLLAFIAIRSIMLGYSGPASPRMAVYVVWVALAMVVLCTMIFRQRIAKHPASRRLMYFGVTMLFGVAVFRTTATAVGISVDQYLLLEVPWLAMLFGLELPLVGRRYLWPILVCVALFLLLLFFPHHRHIYVNPGYGLLCLLAFYGRLAPPGTAKEHPGPPPR